MKQIDEYYKLNSMESKDWEEPVTTFLKKAKQFKLSYLELLKSSFIEEAFVNHLKEQLEDEKKLTKWLSSVKYKGDDEKQYPVIRDLDELHALQVEISNLYMLLSRGNQPKNCEKAIDTFCTNYPFKLSFDEFYLHRIL